MKKYKPNARENYWAFCNKLYDLDNNCWNNDHEYYNMHHIYRVNDQQNPDNNTKYYYSTDTNLSTCNNDMNSLINLLEYIFNSPYEIEKMLLAIRNAMNDPECIDSDKSSVIIIRGSGGDENSIFMRLIKGTFGKYLFKLPEYVYMDPKTESYANVFDNYTRNYNQSDQPCLVKCQGSRILYSTINVNDYNQVMSNIIFEGNVILCQNNHKETVEYKPGTFMICLNDDNQELVSNIINNIDANVTIINTKEKSIIDNKFILNDTIFSSFFNLLTGCNSYEAI